MACRLLQAARIWGSDGLSAIAEPGPFKIGRGLDRLS